MYFFISKQDTRLTHDNVDCDLHGSNIFRISSRNWFLFYARNSMFIWVNGATMIIQRQNDHHKVTLWYNTRFSKIYFFSFLYRLFSYWCMVFYVLQKNIMFEKMTVQKRDACIENNSLLFTRYIPIFFLCFQSNKGCSFLCYVSYMNF